MIKRKKGECYMIDRKRNRKGRSQRNKRNNKRGT